MAEPRLHRLVVRRTARWYALGGDGPSPPGELWLALHGYLELAAEFVRGLAPVAGPERLVVAPEGLSRAYRRGGAGEVGASWMTREDRAAELADQLAYLDALARTLREDHGAPAPAVVLGFSQGAATAARWVAAGGALGARLVAWGALLPPDEDLAGGWERLAAARPLLVAGRSDPVAPPERLAAERARLAAHGVAAELVAFDGGHRLDGPTLAALAERVRG